MARFIDYFPPEEIEDNNSPSGIREGKFVQLRRGDDQFIVFAPTALFTYHAHIVEKFAEEMGISIYKGENTITFRDPEWRIVGGGRMRVDHGSKTVKLWGSSQAYGNFDRRIDEILAKSDELEGYELSISS